MNESHPASPLRSFAASLVHRLRGATIAHQNPTATSRPTGPAVPCPRAFPIAFPLVARPLRSSLGLLAIALLATTTACTPVPSGYVGLTGDTGQVDPQPATWFVLGGDTLFATVRKAPVTLRLPDVAVTDVHSTPHRVDLSVTYTLNMDAMPRLYLSQRADPRVGDELAHEHTVGQTLLRTLVPRAAAHITAQKTFDQDRASPLDYALAIGQDVSSVMRAEHPGALRTVQVTLNAIDGRPVGAGATLDINPSAEPVPTAQGWTFAHRGVDLHAPFTPKELATMAARHAALHTPEEWANLRARDEHVARSGPTLSPNDGRDDSLRGSNDGNDFDAVLWMVIATM